MTNLRVASLGLWAALYLTACSGSDASPEDGSTAGHQTASDTGGTPSIGGATVGRGGLGNGGSFGGVSGALSGGTGGGPVVPVGGQSQGGGGQGTTGGWQSVIGGQSPSGGAGAGGQYPTTGGQGGISGGGQGLGGEDGGQSGTVNTGGTQTGGMNEEGGASPNVGGEAGTGEAGGEAGGGSGGMNDAGAGGTPPTAGRGPVVIPEPGPNGELYPFPREVDYPYGVQSTAVSSDDVKSWYDSWRSRYLVECNGNLMPSTENSSIAKVEAAGFAMVAAAYMGDKEAVDGLWGFYKSKTSSQGCGLMGWQVSCGGVSDSGAATDGDVDVASGLVVAHWQWPDDGYDEKANEVIGNLRALILDCGGTSALHPGCSGGRPWGGCNETDISYYSPAFFRHFAEISGDEAWTKLADDTHVIRDKAANSNTGLVPDWQSTSGTPGSGSRAGYFGFDAIRVPYKHCLDFLFTGNSAAEAWCNKVSSWANGVGVGSLRDGYNLDGSARGGNHNLAIVGSMTVAAMANTQEVVDAFAEESAKMRDDFWYSGYLGNLYLLAMSGNMWTPEIAGY